MIYKTLSEVIGSKRDIAWGNGQSRRFLLAQDGLPFTFTDTTVNAGTDITLQYQQHLELCYCLEGEGKIVLKNKTLPLRPGVLYVLDKHDIHRLVAHTNMRFVCVFIPPLQGNEKHKINFEEPSSY